MTWGRGLLRRFRRSSDCEESVQLQLDDVQTLRRMLEESQHPMPRVSLGRSATRDELVLAAWANLAIEEPSVTLQEARRAIDEMY